MEITEEMKGILLIAARDAIRSLFGSNNPPFIDYKIYPVLAKTNVGAFVTLTERGLLRGCIGYIHSEDSLFDTVVNAARHAAINDPRFPPLNDYEISDIDIEISVLTEAVPISSYEEIEIGKHGLILQEGMKSGLLLPQVATENDFTVAEFLTAICQKAGVDPYLWQKKKLNLKTFTAIVFSESGKRKRKHEHS